MILNGTILTQMVTTVRTAVAENIYRYLEPKFKPQQWVKYHPYGALYRAKTAQVAEVRSDDCGRWVYLLPKDLEDFCILAEFPEDMIRAEEDEI